jgi:hypothetical protein
VAVHVAGDRVQAGAAQGRRRVACAVVQQAKAGREALPRVGRQVDGRIDAAYRLLRPRRLLRPSTARAARLVEAAMQVEAQQAQPRLFWALAAR